jgi:PleD family two-component response regulator
MSIGVASALPGKDIKLERLVAVADRALYQAKKLGRDRVIAMQVQEKA